VWGVIGTLFYGLIVGLLVLILGLIFGSFYGLIHELIYGLILGLIFGLIHGLIYGLIDNLTENQIKKRIWLINGLILGLIPGLIGLNLGSIFGAIFGLTFGLILGLINGLIFGLIENKIQTIETLNFSLKKPLNWLRNGQVSDLRFSLIFIGIILQLGLIYSLIGSTKNGLFSQIILLIVGLSPMLIGLLISGINGLEIENKTIPNQGIRQSVLNTIIFSAVTFLPTALIVFIIEVSLKHDTSNQVLILSLVSGILFGMLVGIVRSGTPVIKHFILRIILWFSGYTPWNYAKFLNYSTDRLFLQRVGGSYRFMHDLLRQHFANSYGQKI
ncbi:MAG: hypothetical protein PUP91_38620, partial [Rhizonema sp. PD37]|nr:hypothetical protein [Rhizonema sp. PD37]